MLSRGNLKPAIPSNYGIFDTRTSKVLPASAKYCSTRAGSTCWDFAHGMDARSRRAAYRLLPAAACLRLRAIYAGGSEGPAGLDQARRHPFDRGPNAYRGRNQISHPVHLVACWALRRANRWSDNIERGAL